MFALRSFLFRCLISTKAHEFSKSLHRFKKYASLELNYLNTDLPHYNFTSSKYLSRMFSSRTPCHVGDHIGQIETPALVVCLKKLEENLNKMKTIMELYPDVKLRPHGKTHKCAMLGKLQVKLGAIGVCCQKITEAEAMVNGGIQDVFVSNQIINKKKLFRLASLARNANISVCVDSEQNIIDISEVASTLNVTVDLVIEVNVGGFRCGVEPGVEAVLLAKRILSLPNIRFKGLHCYNGKNQHIRSYVDRKSAVEEVVEKTKLTLDELSKHGIKCNYVTGGGTGTFLLEAASGIFTEVQPKGSYVFMDVDYGKNLDESEKFVSEFKQSLYVLSTVQSVSYNRAVVDVGLKAVSLDSGEPTLKESDQVYISGGDEHGIIIPPADLKVGDKLWLIPGHCDPTVNMHEWMVGLRDGKVESIWPISGRGPGL